MTSRKLFQFHKGAIRTPILSEETKIIAMFQFHKGAIRTGLQYVSDVCAVCFNSIKVQLERKEYPVSVDYFIRFNSIKVQLEPITTRIVTSSFTMGFGDLLVKDLSLKNVDI